MYLLGNDSILYHGSWARVEHIDLCCCASGRDFGRGFYLTSDYEQAKRFVKLSVKKHAAVSGFDSGGGYVCSYRLQDPAALSIRTFEHADKDWLHFVSANRRGELFPDLLEMYQGFDVVAGKIANDQTARTLQLYTSGAFGLPGSSVADDIAISMLLPNRLSDQFCFRTEASLHHLIFEGSEFFAG